MMFCLLGLTLLLPVVVQGWTLPGPHHGVPSNEKTSLTLLYQNNLNASDDANHAGAILLDPMHQHDVREACESVGETLLSNRTIYNHRDDFKNLFAYLAHTGRSDTTQPYYLREGVLSVTQDPDTFHLLPFPRRNFKYPVLCTQTSTGIGALDAAIAKSHVGPREVRVASEGNMYIGSRDRKSFRFLGIPYADRPQRFMHSNLYSRRSETIRAMDYGANCIQPSGGSEDCLFLNIQTPYLPQAGSADRLKPVLFWIHGGGFTSGTGSDPLTDGGNLASREDIVVVNFNYRLSTLGFLAMPDANVPGNFGLGDQVVALEWTIRNIAQFGGDPNRITIVGESAGATSVRALLGSPPAQGMFHAAIAMSGMGGGASLGLEGSDASRSSSYMSISESYRLSGHQVVNEVGCDTGSPEQQLQCLEKTPASKLVNLTSVPRYIVQDEYFVTGKELNLIERNTSIPSIPIMMGITADDGAPLTTYPTTPIKTLSEGLQIALNITAKHAEHILSSDLYPSPESGNTTLDAFDIAQRISTDLHFRCIAQATIFAGVASSVFDPSSSFYYQFETTTADYYADHIGSHAATPDFPHGDLDLPYFRLHGSDLPWVFGTLEPLRDGMDLDTLQLLTGYWGSFVRSGQPNPPAEWLAARGYESTRDAVGRFDRWEPVAHSEGPMQLLGYPSFGGGFQNQEQCELLGYPVTYYFR